MRTLLASLTVIAAFAAAVSAHAFDLPLQLDVTTTLATAGAKRRLTATLAPGDAVVKIVARGARGGDTTRVDVVFRYRIPRDQIALDEIIDGIEITTEDPMGGVFGTVTIDTHEVNLNPNRVPLAYAATLYHPEPPYVVRIRVFGNYE